MVRRLHIKVRIRGLDPPEHQLIRPCTWLKFTLKYHAWFEIRKSKFENMNRPGDPVLAKFRSLRPAEKALLSPIYILSAMTKFGPKPIFWGPIGWGTVPHWIGPKKMGFGPNFDIGEFYDPGGPRTLGELRNIAAAAGFCAQLYAEELRTQRILKKLKKITGELRTALRHAGRWAVDGCGLLVWVEAWRPCCW